MNASGASATRAHDVATRILLTCGIGSSLWYVAINVIVPLQWPSYSVADQAVSELSAVGAPTRTLWVGLALPYVLLLAAFGVGVRAVAGDNRRYARRAG